MELTVTIDENVLSDLTAAENTRQLPDDLFKEIRGYGKRFEHTLPLSTVIKLARWQCHKSKERGLHKLLNDSTVNLPTLPTRTVNPELQARLKRLQHEQDQVQYDRMVSNVSTKSDPSLKRRAPVTSGLNFAVTMVACVFGTAFVLRDLVDGLTLRVAIGIAVGTIVMCIEIFLAVRAIQREENAKR